MAIVENRTGKFLVFEGTDGSGKRTQVDRMANWAEMRGHKVFIVDFPQYRESFFGRLVGAYLNGDYGSLKDVHPVVASVLYAGDRFEKSGEIKQALEESKLVLSNRYTPSNKAHQGSKISKDQWPVFCQHIDQMEYDVFKVPKEDWVFLLDVTPEIGQKLVDEKADREWLAEKQIGGIRKRDIAEEDLDHQMKASDVYKWMATFYPNWSLIQCCDLQGQILPKETIGDLVIAETERLNILPR